MNDSSQELVLCKKSFQYFLYTLRSKRNSVRYFGGRYIASTTLLEDENFDKYSLFQNQIIKPEPLTLIKNHTRQIGFTTFLAFYVYYISYYKPCSNVFWVTDPKHFSRIGKIISEIGLALQDVMNCMVTINAPSKELTFSHNSSSIKFLNDTTYEFRSFKERIDLVVFDSAGLHNYDKLSFFLEGVTMKSIADRVIMNFDVGKEKSVEQVKSLEYEFPGFINIIERIN